MKKAIFVSLFISNIAFASDLKNKVDKILESKNYDFKEIIALGDVKDETISAGLKEKYKDIFDKIAKPGLVLKEFNHPGNFINSITFSPDNKYILTALDFNVILRDMNNLDLDLDKLKMLRTDMGRLNSVDVSPDGKYIIVGSSGTGYPNTLQLWSINDLDSPKSVSINSKSVSSAKFSPNSKYILAGSSDGIVRLWDISNLNRDERFSLARSLEYIITPKELIGHKDWVNSVAFSPDGKFALTGSRDKTARLWDLSNLTSKELTGHEKMVNSVAFSPDGEHILTGSDDGTVRLWDLSNLNNFKELKGHKDSVNSVAFSSDGKFVLTGSSDKTARLWNISNLDNITSEELKNKAPVVSVAFSSDGKYFATGTLDGIVTLSSIRINFSLQQLLFIIKMFQLGYDPKKLVAEKEIDTEKNKNNYNILLKSFRNKVVEDKLENLFKKEMVKSHLISDVAGIVGDYLGSPEEEKVDIQVKEKEAKERASSSSSSSSSSAH